MKKTFMLIACALLSFLTFSCENTVVQASSNLAYYGYHGFSGIGAGDAQKADALELVKFNNFVIVPYSESWDSDYLRWYVNEDHKNGYNTLISLTGYFNNEVNFNNTGDWPRFLNDLSLKLGADVDKVWGFYVMDEPEDHFAKWPDKVMRTIEMTKATFPNSNTFVNFFEPWTPSYQYNFADSPFLDYIGINPYFFTVSVKENVSNSGGDPYACDAQTKWWFDYKVRPMIYWIKSGGNYIEDACNNKDWPNGCIPEQLAAVNAIISRDTSKKIIITAQSFECSLGPFATLEMPSICQQQWYYDYAKSDPDVEGLLWYKYSPEGDYANFMQPGYVPRNESGPTVIFDCVGVGKPTPEVFAHHKIWGLEVLCTNQELKPFCANDSVSYKNPDQAKCLGKTVNGSGGSGNNLCDAACGADQMCHGKAPGIELCDENCKSYVIPVYPGPFGDVDILDLILIATHFGQTNDHLQWNTTVDVVADGKIDIYDIVFVASRFT